MKSPSRRFLAAAFGLNLAGLVWLGEMGLGRRLPVTDEHVRVSPEEFDKLMRSLVSDTRDVSFVGLANDRVYLSEWRLSGATDAIRVCSAPVAGMPGGLSAMLRQGKNPWREDARSNNPGLTAAELDAIDSVMRHPPQLPVRLLLRLSTNKMLAARDHFDGRFTEDDVLPIPVPCDLVVIVSGNEQLSGPILVGVNGTPWIAHAGTGADYHRMHISEIGDLEVAIDVNGWKRTVTVRGIDASRFYGSKEAQARSRR
jgi:hypothetical protein